MSIPLLISKTEDKQSVLYDEAQSKPLICKDFTLFSLILLSFRDNYWFDSISDLACACLKICIHIYANMKPRIFLS